MVDSPLPECTVKNAANPLAADLDMILERTRDLWEEMRGERLFVTGGTGFFGCWLLESFAWANTRLNLGAEAVVLTRRPEAFAAKAPHLASHPAIRLLCGDVRSFAFPEGTFSHVIHAATEWSTSLNEDDPLRMLDTIIAGTRRALDFAVACRAQKFLLTSSGAVYGRHPVDISHLPEDYAGAPDTMEPRSAYGEGKRLAELLCAIYARQHGLQTKIARCFAFVGPYLPLDTHFAVGNFIRDGLAGESIRISGDGTPYRSYLYAADLAVWLWTILLRGRSERPYNVGSDEGMTIAELAQAVGSYFGINIDIGKRPTPGLPTQRYVPSTLRAREELGLSNWVPFADALDRTVSWHRNQPLPSGSYVLGTTT